ncbi:MAG TPA: VWA domain-containing protein [Thermoanaerobaculia bacterium]|nr:VWA domain-containing protein [Thermoanaerobaculia bacterium]
MTNVFPHLASPWWLLLLLALPLLAWRHHRRRALGALTYSRLPVGAGRGLRRGAWRLHLPFYARLAALVCLALALARPQLGYAWEESLTQGIDIEIVLDVSGSMGAEDFQPKDRLSVAKQVVKEFVAGRPGDRIGMVVFSGAAMTRAPLTTDREMLGMLVDSVQLNTLPDGTAIGVALASAAARLKDSAAKTKVMVLATDGANNAGAIDPASAAALCQGLGIKVYTIGVGALGRVPVPVPTQDPTTGAIVTRRVMMDVPVDEPLLKQIAARTGGQFYRATDTQGLQRIFREIDRLEKTPIQVKRYVRYQEAFPALVWAGLALLLLPLAAAGLEVTAEP